MGASESTARSNGTTEEEEEPRQEHNRSRGRSIATIATAAAGVAVVAWGVAKALSDNTNDQETDHHVTGPSFPYSPEGINQRSLIWSRPSQGRLKMNTDGSSNPPPIGSGYGGILRDHNGKWVKGFIGFIGESDSLTTEIHGIHKGLELLDKLRLKGAILETDSEPAWKWVKRRDDHRGKREIIPALFSVIKECRDLVDRNDVEFNCIPRVANQSADKLADIAVHRREKYVVLEDLPDTYNELRKHLEKALETDAKDSA